MLPGVREPCIPHAFAQLRELLLLNASIVAPRASSSCKSATSVFSLSNWACRRRRGLLAVAARPQAWARAVEATDMAWTTADRTVLVQPLGNGGRADVVGFDGIWSSRRVTQEAVGEDILSAYRRKSSRARGEAQESLD